MSRRPTEVRRAVVLMLSMVLLASGSSLAEKARAAAPVGLEAAKSALSRSDLDAAEKSLWQILSRAPTNSDALTLLGIVRGRQQRYGEAEALFRRVLQVNPKSVVALRNLASALLAQEKVDEAIAQYQEVIQAAPRDASLKVELAHLYLGKGDFPSALNTLESIPANSFPADALPLKAASLLGVGRKSEAEVLAGRAISSPQVTLELAKVFLAAQQPDAALKTINTAMSRGRRKGFALTRGLAQLQMGDFAAASLSFRQELAIDPRSVDAMAGQAEVYAAQENHAESFATLQKARELAPDSPAILRPLIVEAMRSGHNDVALEATARLQQHSTLAEDKYLAASVLLQEQRYTAAARLLEDYVAQRPQDAKGFLGLGMAYSGQLHYPEARQALERSQELDSSAAETHFQLAQVAQKEGKRGEAMQQLQRTVELQPGHAKAQFTLGTLYLESGELDKALEALQRAQAADPRDPKIEYDLGLVLSKQGKAEEARQHMELYRKLDQAQQAAGRSPRPESR